MTRELLPAAIAVAACIGCDAITGLDAYQVGEPTAGAGAANANGGGGASATGGGGAGATGGGAGGGGAGGCDAQTQTDPLNCGACGHDCLGSDCLNGQCQPIPFITTDGDMLVGVAVDATHIYWTADSLWRSPLASLDSRQDLLPGGFSGEPGYVTLDTRHVYWADGDTNQVVRAAHDGTNQEVLVLDDGSDTTSGIAVDETYVYWTTYYGGEVLKQALAGGSPVPIDEGDTPEEIAIHDGTIYWTDFEAETVHSTPVDGGPISQLSDDTGPAGITTDDAYVYWTSNEGDDGAITRMAHGGGPAETLLTLPDADPIGIAVDASWIYFGDYYGDTIYRVAK